MTRTVLVTGAAGFIGSHCVEALLDHGDRVVGLDNLDDYYPPARKRSNLAEIGEASGAAERFDFVEGDIRDAAMLERLLPERGVDAIVHLAALGGVRRSVEQPQRYVDVNLVGTLTVLEAARACQVSQVVFASTSSVYGETSELPFVETDGCDRPLALYPATKRSCELLGHSYHHVHGLSFTGLRFFTVYGPRGRPDMMPYKILAHLFLGEDVPLYGGGRMLRDWTYVGDIAQAIVAAVDRPQGYELINVGRGEPLLVADFIAEVERQTGLCAHFRSEQPLATDMTRTHADLTKARALLGYEPRTPVAEGIARFIEWFRGAVLPPAGDR